MNGDENFNIFLSESAIKQIKFQAEKRNTPQAAFRIGLKSGGCSGFYYHLDFEDNPPKDKDLIFNFDGITVLVDKKSIIYLNGFTLDYKDSFLHKCFMFNNPNAKSSCGCGSSFSPI